MAASAPTGGVRVRLLWVVVSLRARIRDSAENAREDGSSSRPASPARAMTVPSSSHPRPTCVILAAVRAAPGWSVSTTTVPDRACVGRGGTVMVAVRPCRCFAPARQAAAELSWSVDDGVLRGWLDGGRARQCRRPSNLDSGSPNPADVAVTPLTSRAHFGGLDADDFVGVAEMCAESALARKRRHRHCRDRPNVPSAAVARSPAAAPSPPVRTGGRRNTPRPAGARLRPSTCVYAHSSVSQATHPSRPPRTRRGGPSKAAPPDPSANRATGGRGREVRPA